jgi:two-component system nitrate/nitrite response regulator NarL
MLRVLVAGDIRLFREGLALYLGSQPDITVVTTAGSRRELLEALPSTRPDILLLDMAMPDSLPALREVADRAPGTHVIALAVPEIEPAVMACAEAGIAGYVPRDGSLEDLMSAVRRAARGESLLPPRVIGTLLRRLSALAPQAADAPGAAELTARELEIAHLVDEGMSNKLIAGRLCIELSTVKNHMHRILAKLHAQHRAEIPRRLRTARAASDAWETMRR